MERRVSADVGFVQHRLDFSVQSSSIGLRVRVGVTGHWAAWTTRWHLSPEQQGASGEVMPFD
jgi:hypothetical protein